VAQKLWYRLAFRASLFIVVMLFFSSGCFGSPSHTPTYQRITAEAAYRMMQETNNFILLDVRTASEFRGRHIAGAILIPVNELERRAAAELPDKDTVIFIYCRAGVRASNAARTLAGMGYTQLFNIGGIIDWPYETISGN
jgi:rhodanese-related sulfurtransferase